jgi:hypothetical protein
LIVFGLLQPERQPTIYHTGTNHYTIDLVGTYIMIGY